MEKEENQNKSIKDSGEPEKETAKPEENLETEEAPLELSEEAPAEENKPE